MVSFTMRFIASSYENLKKEVTKEIVSKLKLCIQIYELLVLLDFRKYFISSQALVREMGEQCTESF